MKHYEREYERVFTNRERIKQICNKDEISFDGEHIANTEEYAQLLNKTFKEARKAIYELLVRYVWLSRRFCYGDYRRTRLKGNGWRLDAAFGIFVRRYANMDARIFFGSGGPTSFYKVASYFKDFYPTFGIDSPFKIEYKFPYEYVTLEYLVVVYDMDERLELLEYAEENEMHYTEFCDYVLNYINCYNDEHGYKYDWVFSASVGVRKSKRYKTWERINKYEKKRKTKKRRRTILRERTSAEQVKRISKEEK